MVEKTTAASDQQFRKHVPAATNTHSRTNTHETMEERGVFYVARAATVAMHRRSKHASTATEGLCFLRGPCRGIILKTIGATQWGQLSSAREAEKRWRCTRI
jgi:hypothetical protein